MSEMGTLEWSAWGATGPSCKAADRGQGDMTWSDDAEAVHSADSATLAYPCGNLPADAGVDIAANAASITSSDVDDFIIMSTLAQTCDQ